jgi:type IX secretion system PorP/SprF family membrane protein
MIPEYIIDKKPMLLLRKTLLVFFAVTACNSLYGQQSPFNPVSYRIYTPFVLNPAAAGSKDYLSVDMNAGFRGQSHSQILSANTRLSKKVLGYLPSGRSYAYSNIGAGLYGYNEYEAADSTHDAGVSASASYHIPLSRRGLSFVSIGASVKGMYHFKEGNPDLDLPSREYWYPNIDFGVYIYNPKAYAGISMTNLLHPPKDTAMLNNYSVPVSRQYHLIGGYKFVLSESMDIVLEPSVLIHTDDSLSFDIKESIEPLIKLYVGNFCIGTYFNDYSKVSFFFQYRYPKFYIGTYFALPKDSPFYKKALTSEIAVGINFSPNKSGYTKSGHW